MTSNTDKDTIFNCKNKVESQFGKVLNRLQKVLQKMECIFLFLSLRSMMTVVLKVNGGKATFGLSFRP